MTEQPWVRVACYAWVTDGEGRVLLCRLAGGEPDGGRWTLPGGGVEFGEDLAEACLREVREETGLEVRLGPIVEAHAELVASSRGPLHAVRIVYLATVLGGSLRAEAEGSTDHCEFLPVDELEETPVVPLVLRARAAAQAQSDSTGLATV